MADVNGYQKDSNVSNNISQVSVTVEEDVNDDELADIFDYLGYGIDLANVNFTKKVLPDGSVVVQVGTREVYVSSVGGSPYTGSGTLDSPWVYPTSGFSTGSAGSWAAFGFGPSYPSSSSPGVPGEPLEEKFYIQSIDASNFSVIYDRVDLEGDDFAHKPVRIETAFGNINFTYYGASDASAGVSKGDFASTDDIELFEVLLESVGAKSVDDLSDIFVTRAFTKAGTITQEEAALKNRIANLWTRIGYIALMPNTGIDKLTVEERKRLLDFEENLLAATALTDEFRGYGFREDALLLGEMVQLGRVYAALNPQLKDKPAAGGSAPSLPPKKPDALLLTTAYSYLAEDYVAIESRLTQLGYNVITKKSSDFARADADGMELIVAADYSGPIKLDFADLAVPVVVLDNRKLDNLALAAASQTVVSGPVWIDASGQLTTERFMGELVLRKDDVPGKTVALLNPTTLDLNLGVKSFLNGLSYSPIYANVQSGSLLNGQTGDERRVAFIGFVDSFTYLNDAGLQSFDAAVNWSANLKTNTNHEFSVDYSLLPEDIRSDAKDTFGKISAPLPKVTTESFISFLDEFWQISNANADSETVDGLKDRGLAELNAFELETKNDFQLLNYGKKLLQTLALVPSLQDTLNDAYFIQAMLQVGKEFFLLKAQDESVSIPFLQDVLKAGQESDFKLAATNLQEFMDSVKAKDKLTIAQMFLEDVRTIAQFSSDPSVYTGLNIWVRRENPYHEEQRIWALEAVARNAVYICQVADYYGLTAHAIAGAILWEALENPFDSGFLSRGTGLLRGTRPGNSDDYGILGKIHVGAGEVSMSPEVINRVAERRPDGVPTITSSRLPDSMRLRPQQLEFLLLDNEELAIEYIGAILDYRRDLYESIFERYDEVMDLRDQAGILTVLYQGGLEDNPERLELLEQRASDGIPGNNRPQFPETDAMGPWVSQFRWQIAWLLEENGCKQENTYSNYEVLRPRVGGT